MFVGDLYSVTPAGTVPFQPGPGDGVLLRSGAGRPFARDLKDVGPRVEHRHQVVAVLHLRDGEDVRLLREIEPGDRVQRVGVGRGHVLELRGRISSHVRELAHRGVVPVGLRDVGHDPAGHLHRDERVPVDVRVHRDPEALGVAHGGGRARVLRAGNGYGGAEDDDGRSADGADEQLPSFHERKRRNTSAVRARARGTTSRTVMCAFAGTFVGIAMFDILLPLLGPLLRSAARFRTACRALRRWLRRRQEPETAGSERRPASLPPPVFAAARAHRAGGLRGGLRRRDRRAARRDRRRSGAREHGRCRTGRRRRTGACGRRERRSGRQGSASGGHCGQAHSRSSSGRRRGSSAGLLLFLSTVGVGMPGRPLRVRGLPRAPPRAARRATAGRHAVRGTHHRPRGRDAPRARRGHGRTTLATSMRRSSPSNTSPAILEVAACPARDSSTGPGAPRRRRSATRAAASRWQAPMPALHRPRVFAPLRPLVGAARGDAQRPARAAGRRIARRRLRGRRGGSARGGARGRAREGPGREGGARAHRARGRDARGPRVGHPGLASSRRAAAGVDIGRAARTNGNRCGRQRASQWPRATSHRHGRVSSAERKAHLARVCESAKQRLASGMAATVGPRPGAGVA